MATITLCADSPTTETLTLNRMKVNEFWVGQRSTAQGPASSIPPFLLELIHQAVAFGVHRASPSPGTELEFWGGPAEKAILPWTVVELEKTKRSCVKILGVEHLGSEPNPSGVLIGRNIDDTVHVHWKGAAETILAMCSAYYDASGAVKDLDGGQRTKFQQMIQAMAAGSIGCIGFAHKQVPEQEYDDPDHNKLLNGNSLTLLGLVGIKG
ncbi:hypothetical protein V6N13_013550 [Hibiscus sabdariffa]|uniref:Uncharacterized protein n=2 Tax=Hibiscus sabdariffa TaxID=183260 RepID=A0ABR2BVN2_9ROSI